MDINFELYKVFYYAGKHLNFSEAANHLYITQSAVSQSIKQLEAKLHIQLFMRHTKKIRLTPEGESLFKYVEQAFFAIKSGERTLQAIQNLQHGEVRIAASDTICKYYLLPYLKEFHQKYPHIKIHITNRPSPVCMELLNNGVVDISVVNMLNHEAGSSLNIHPFKRIQDVFIAGKAFESLKGEKLSLKSLAGYPFLLLEKNSTTRRFLDDFLKKYEITLSPEVELDSIDLLIEFTKIGLGISYVMEDTIKDALENQDLFILELEEAVPQRQVAILTHRQIPTPLSAQRFIELLGISY
ncbi:DNA-binding transcriptional LysR family regulator [Anaerosolibacter carboniphilus]|uniref:DNA-binding transcriptional LysR family regulator n=1 Tax=Anaerosolibacter carboniphilus TaxID=1417629 RepID=A0A841L8X7_9FIRM|nr:LysR family transcriptional regulator [Anaerosolibacter carboniphilus]MBB6218839.1 DNA-binding transcriptional LysR family regulator [Anaerosolibacter carboniphilus]